ncbi:hypothetical protein RRG08_009133 [Elysia crispata]|uniref:Uncharacterized protein n=1 Tax=Elysia crispata TaxID=231223 RepID=A0AAE0YPB3_9GAST|nr:hypothetical protein RRG08_009133 [Elysia crispata]
MSIHNILKLGASTLQLGEVNEKISALCFGEAFLNYGSFSYIQLFTVSCIYRFSECMSAQVKVRSTLISSDVRKGQLVAGQTDCFTVTRHSSSGSSRAGQLLPQY